ncbi:MAG: hypothetical protein CMG46_01925 [Candidatus Marinimicrobia bacterium]|nr:hypothetical protein [Candidatus Neomarinimicrobiota bacterium]|tara:strand:- start:815 stop:1186 length:372 start_codon:yes stop_codon:yes gene_type:complete
MDYIKYDPTIVYNSMIKGGKYYNNYTCFNILNNYININSFYKLLSSCSIHNLNNILNYINIHWTIIKRDIDKKYKNNKYKGILINTYCKSYDDFNNNIIEFINGEIAIAIMCVNIINAYLYIN